MFARWRRGAGGPGATKVSPPDTSASNTRSTCAMPARATRSPCLRSRRLHRAESPPCARRFDESTGRCSATRRRRAGRDRLLSAARHRPGVGRRVPRFEPTGATLSDALREIAKSRFGSETLDCPVYQRERLDVGHRLLGPAIIDQLDCTTVSAAGQTARSMNGRTSSSPRTPMTCGHRRTRYAADRRHRSRDHQGEPRRHRAGNAELAVSHRLFDHRAGIPGRLLRDDERARRRRRPARRAAAAYRRVSGLLRGGDARLATTSPKATPS